MLLQWHLIILQVSAVELERACISAVPDVLEAAAVAVPEGGGGPDQLVMFVVPSTAEKPDPKVVHQQCQRAIRDSINPLFKLKKVCLLSIFMSIALSCLVEIFIRGVHKGLYDSLCKEWEVSSQLSPQSLL